MRIIYIQPICWKWYNVGAAWMDGIVSLCQFAALDLFDVKYNADAAALIRALCVCLVYNLTLRSAV